MNPFFAFLLGGFLLGGKSSGVKRGSKYLGVSTSISSSTSCSPSVSYPTSSSPTVIKRKNRLGTIPGRFLRVLPKISEQRP